MKPRHALAFAGLLAAASGGGCLPAPALYVVNTPVTDLREKPETLPTSYRQDPDQATQLLYGERVRFIRTKATWSCVEAVEQAEYTHHHRWEGYLGWVASRALHPLPRGFTPKAVVTRRWATLWKDEQARTPWFRVALGTRLDVVPAPAPLWRVRLVSGDTGWVSRGDVSLSEELTHLSGDPQRLAVIHAAEQLLGDRYLWGGRSPFSDSPDGAITGVDCSGLVNLSYRAAGLDIPRDAHEQYLRARKIAQLQPADLVFLSDAHDPATITHVMLYVGDGQLIEAPGTGGLVRLIDMAKRLGRPLEQLTPGSKADGRTIAFGRYID